MPPVINARLKELIVILVFAVLLLSVALFNGYPLVTSDSGSYIRHAFDFQLPADRSPFYGVFTGIFSLRYSLWFSIMAQSLLLGYLLLRYLKALGIMPGLLLRVIIVTAIVLFTSVAWVNSYLMPDIFAGILLLACILFILENQKGQSYIYLFIILVATLVHNSHFLILSLFSFLLVMGSFFKKNKIVIRKGLLILSLSVASWLFVSGLYYVKGFGFTLSPGKHVFMMGKLAETGILKKYLDDSCGKKNLKLCAYKNELPAVAFAFLWDENGPLYKTGGWDSSKTEYDIIIKDVFTSRTYLTIFAARSVSFTSRQLLLIQLPNEITPLGEGSSPWVFIKQYLPQELKSYISSRQNTGQLKPGFFISLHLLFFIISSVWILLIYRRLIKYQPQLAIIYSCVLLFIICNAFVTATFANVLDRLQYRVSWVLPATNAIILIRHYIISCHPAKREN